MKGMKPFLTFIVILSVFSLVIAGCGGSSDDDDEPGGAATTTRLLGNSSLTALTGGTRSLSAEIIRATSNSF